LYKKTIYTSAIFFFLLFFFFFMSSGDVDLVGAKLPARPIGDGVTLPDRARRDFGSIGGRINDTPKKI
jgi:hypothetical protein